MTVQNLQIEPGCQKTLTSRERVNPHRIRDCERLLTSVAVGAGELFRTATLVAVDEVHARAVMLTRV